MFLLNDSTHRMLMRYHRLLGHLHVPGLCARVPHEAGGYFVRTNQLGFRSDYEFHDHRTQRPKILVFGDSFTAGEGCENRERYPELIGEMLGVKVYNYGLSGSGPDQHLLIYKTLAAAAEADLVIWGISIHNIQRIKLSHRISKDRVSGRSVLIPRPYFKLKSDALELHNVPVPRQREYLESDTEVPYPEGSQYSQTALARFIPSFAIKEFRDFVEKRVPHITERIRGSVFRMADVQIYDDYLSSESDGWQLLAALIKEFRREVKSIPILIVPLPTYHYYIDRLKPCFSALFRSIESPREHLFVADITSDLCAGKSFRERRALCFKRDSHYSQFGHIEIARLIAEEIKRRQLVPIIQNTNDIYTQKTCKESNLPTFTLGLHFDKYDSAAAISKDGELLAAARESFFVGTGDGTNFPKLAINYCLEEAQINQDKIAAIVCSNDILEQLGSYLAILFKDLELSTGRDELATAMTSGLNFYQILRASLSYEGPIYRCSASGAQCVGSLDWSRFGQCTIINFYGDKLGSVVNIAVGNRRGIRLHKRLDEELNIQMFYELMKQCTAHMRNCAQTPLWKLARGGRPMLVEPILNDLINLNLDGSISQRIDMFSGPWNVEGAAERLVSIFKEKDTKLHDFGRDLARSAQEIICDAVVKLARHVQEETGETKLCLSGELCLDPKIRRRLQEANIFEEIWFHPLTGGCAAAAGAAAVADRAEHVLARNEENRGDVGVKHRDTRLGPSFSDEEIDGFVTTYGYPAVKLRHSELVSRAAELVLGGKVVALFSGRMNVGLECLNDRIVLCANLRRAGTCQVGSSEREGLTVFDQVGFATQEGLEINAYKTGFLDVEEGEILRVGDGSESPFAFEVFSRLLKLSGRSSLYVAPLSLFGRNFVCTPLDAYRCFMESDIDVLVLGNCLMFKDKQPVWKNITKTTTTHVSADGEKFDMLVNDTASRIYRRFNNARRSVDHYTQSECFDEQMIFPGGCAVDFNQPIALRIPMILEKEYLTATKLEEILVSNNNDMRKDVRFVIWEIVKLQRRLSNIGRG